MLATAGGPNFTTGPASGTLFPVLQTILVADEGSNTIMADLASMASGALAFINAAGSVEPRDGSLGSFPDFSGHDDLDWTRIGYWSNGGVFDINERGYRAAIVVGYRTSEANMPTTGSATYSGRAEGRVFVPVPLGSGAIHANAEEIALSGTAAVVADFGARNVTGSLTGMTAAGEPWNDISVRASIAGNAFTGDTSVTTAPTGQASLATGASGTVAGQFFGPTAQEVGAVWTLHDGTKAAIGTLSGKRP